MQSRGPERELRHVERAYGRFERTIELPCEVEADKVSASHKKGVLSVTLPKIASRKAWCAADRGSFVLTLSCAFPVARSGSRATFGLRQRRRLPSTILTFPVRESPVAKASFPS